MFRLELAKLVSSDKPIINSLTMLAQAAATSPTAATAMLDIVQNIEDYLRLVQPNAKLSVMYLMDSICKNVGGKYIDLFSKNLVSNFFTAYGGAISTDRPKLHRLMDTWRNHMNQGPLFHPTLLKQIDDKMVERIKIEYKTALLDLKVNDKPIITHLTILAESHSNYASIVVQIIEDHLKNAQPPIKLPVLYLLDSICKNVGGAYIDLFSRNIVRTFTIAFSAASPEDRHRMNKLIETWKPSVQFGGIFHPNLIAQMEKVARGGADSSMFGRVNREVEQQILSLLSAKTQQPQDFATMEQIKILRELQSRVQSSPLTPSDALSITQSLRNMYAGPPAPFLGQPASTSFPGSTLISASPFPPSTIPLAQPAFGAPAASIDEKQLQNILLSFTGSSDSSILPSKPLDILPTNGDVDSDDEEHPEEENLPAEEKEALVAQRKQLRAVKKKQQKHEIDQSGLKRPILAFNITLTTSDMKIPRKSAVSLLYDNLKEQCTQCGFRYPSTELGRQKMTDHLDWHFRQNRRIKEKDQKTISRDWYLTVQDWIEDREVDDADKMGKLVSCLFILAPFQDVLDANAGQKVETETLENLKQDDVADLARHPCGICHEAFETEWDKELEEFMVMNAIKVDGKLLHHSCFLSQKKAKPDASTASPSLGKRKLEPSTDTKATKKAAL